MICALCLFLVLCCAFHVLCIVCISHRPRPWLVHPLHPNTPYTDSAHCTSGHYLHSLLHSLPPPPSLLASPFSSPALLTALPLASLPQITNLPFSTTVLSPPSVHQPLCTTSRPACTGHWTLGCQWARRSGSAADDASLAGLPQGDRRVEE